MTMRQARLYESRHPDQDQLMPPDPACPFCGSEDLSAVFVLRQDPEVRLLKCANCRAVSASRIPAAEALDAFYEDYYTSSRFPADTERINFDNAQRFGRHLAVRVGRHLRTPSFKILDFGGGDGSVALRTAEQLLGRGVEWVRITVVDPNQTLAETTDKRISMSRQDTIDGLPTYGYDLVIASAVIEHLPQPRGILDSLLNLLGKGGIFYARIPYRVPFIKWFTRLGMEWETMFPAHIHDLGQDFWEAFFGQLVSAADCALLESRPSIVESSFSNRFLKALVAYSLKAPWYLLGKRYTLVGGWQVLVRRESASKIGVACPSSSR